ncbi:MAG: 16S rRNA (uracil1498-N3)-methyltransferase [Akkermansiaceae bacterium]|jgi:16S rRNA (uracil1498-N3)-methyltransferase
MDRFFLSPEQWALSPMLTGDEARHCCRVMRKKEGDQILVFDGGGREGKARIVKASKSEVRLEVLSTIESDALNPLIEIAVGIPKGKTFDLILQKAVEMGVTRIQPLMSEQGNVRFHDDEGIAKLEKWQRVVLEACKQCGQNFLPEVSKPMSLDSYLEDLEPGFSRFVGALTPGTKTFRTLLGEVKNPERMTLLIGPEGDFSAGEYEGILEAGFAPVSLGNLVLRTETAVFWMIAAVRYQFQS